MPTHLTRRTLALSAAAIALAAKAHASPEKPVIGVVVKIGGIPWFNAMDAGIKKKSAELGVKAFMVGPTSADPALQVRAIEDLIAQKVDVIGVVPNDAEVLEPVLERARQAGIKVITHEVPEPEERRLGFRTRLRPRASARRTRKRLAETMGGKGEYAVYVGSLTVPLHNAWADAAIAYLKANYPDMKLVGDRYGVAENVDDSRKTALDLMPPTRISRASWPSAARARSAPAARSRSGSAARWSWSGPFSPGQGRKLVKDGADPAATCGIREAGRRGVRHPRQDAGQGRGDQRRHEHPGPRRRASRSKATTSIVDKLVRPQQGHGRRARQDLGALTDRPLPQSGRGPHRASSMTIAETRVSRGGSPPSLQLDAIRCRDVSRSAA